MRQAGYLGRERQHQNRIDHAGRNGGQRIAAFDRFRNLVKQFMRGQRRRVGELHGGSDRAIVSCQGNYCLDHKINRHQIQTDLAIADVQERQSTRPSAQIMNQIINAVIFRGLAGVRIAANNRRTMNRDRKFSFKRLNFQLRRIFRFLVMIAKAGGVLQLVFVNHSLALAGHVTGRDIVIAAQTRNGPGEAVHIARSFDVYALRYLMSHREVIDCGQVKHGSRFRSD